MPLRNAKFTYTPEEHDYLLFAWEGGAYIDVYVGDEESPREAINVWDYENDIPTIERTPEALRAECDEWIEDQD